MNEVKKIKWFIFGLTVCILLLCFIGLLIYDQIDVLVIIKINKDFIGKATNDTITQAILTSYT